MGNIPKEGFKGLVENWQSDILAAFSVSLVALPLALGIAIASGAPPMSGILAAIIGGIVTTFFRGSHVGINGPAAGLIAVILSSVYALDDGSGQTFNYVLAAIVISGGLQILLGLLRLGVLADIFPNSVIHGMLAAIGIIIISKQLPIALDIEVVSHSIIDTILEVAVNLHNTNPFVAIISVTGLLILILNARFKFKLFNIFPAPIWVLIVSIPFVYIFNFFETRSLEFFSYTYEVGPELLVHIPDKLYDCIIFPDFSLIGHLSFWISVISITTIATIETLASTKAVDKLDPYKRKTDLNKDLIGIGISTMVAGCIGGLPIITVIVRSTVNVQNNAKTKWSNFYHGVLILIFIFLLTPFIKIIPLSALAIILVFTGFTLASPKTFKKIYDYGIEQFIFFISTLLITLFTDLLIGILGGIVVVFFTQIYFSRFSFKIFFRSIFDAKSHSLEEKDGKYMVKIKGVTNFLNINKLNKVLNLIPKEGKVNIDLSEIILIDHSSLENIYELKTSLENLGGSLNISGLEKLQSNSRHELALKYRKNLN